MLIKNSFSLSRPPETMRRKRIHVGCGPKALKTDWLNVDIRSFPGVDLVCDITQPWDDLSEVEYVYGEHFLEHLTMDQALAFLQHARGAMAEDGRLRLSTPGLEWVIATHLNPHQTDPAAMLVQTFDINRAFHGWGHQFLWSRAMLEAALTATGYRDVKFYRYGESDDPFLVGIEEHGDYVMHGDLPSTWIVEGRNDPAATVDAAFSERVERDFVYFVRSGH